MKISHLRELTDLRWERTCNVGCEDIQMRQSCESSDSGGDCAAKLVLVKSQHLKGGELIELSGKRADQT